MSSNQSDIRLSLDTIIVEVYSKPETKSYWFAKASLPDVGLFITSIRIVPSKFPGQPHQVYPPTYFIGKSRQQPLEFTSDSLVWQQIVLLAREAVQRFEGGETQGTKWDSVDLDNLPF